MRKWMLAIAYGLSLTAVFFYRNPIMDWLGESGHAGLSLLAATALALFPAVPYKAVIGLFGYVYGSIMGGTLCWLATMAASAIMYGGVLAIFPERGRSYLESIPALDSFTAAVRRRPFASVAAARLLPIIPQAAVNAYAAAAGLPFWSFMLASGLGKIPGIAVFAFLGGNAKEHPYVSAVLTVIYLGALLALAMILKGDGFRWKAKE
ncbi:VTT domain-containing protein [Paenibacillus sp. HN-1]|uniref:TVP38/TMEM64 family protein n=1 Tax=Paenibacillus TaxID=44249 RepID=UPI001CA89379|nr:MULTISPECIES: VTT domain-containing protein [Paenibacillus]MBY9081441.1 VTT domain-containing protein [Paenibacillus sp. CGMCC 1.18879]MBY9084961.1 VTT domain-containing protein [Paenibacillus sinensis]